MEKSNPVFNLATNESLLGY